MNHSLHISLRLLLSYLGIYGFVLLGITGLKISLTKKSWNPKLQLVLRTISSYVNQERVRKWSSNFALAATCLFVGYLAGYATRDIKAAEQDNAQALNIRRYVNVLIAAKHDDRRFRILLNDNDPYEIELCPDSPTDFAPGDKLEYVYFEQRQGCKSLNGNQLGYKAYTDRNGVRIKYELKELTDARSP